jgi:cytochrome c oxidase assembly protein subunit 15
MATGALSLETSSQVRSGFLRDRGWAGRYAWAVVGWNVFVALWGALVRATGSGAGCGNHWPLCNGQVIPISPTWHTVIEFVHRQTVTVSVLTLILMVAWTWRSTAKGMAARVFAVASTILLVNEAFLGALLVILGYVTGNRSLGRVVLLSIHLSNTLLMLGAMTMTATMLGTGQRWRDLRARGLDRRIAVTGLIATLIVGVSGSLAALGDTLFPASSLRAAFAQDLALDSPWLLRLRGVHPLSAFIAAAFVLWLIVRARRQHRLFHAGLVLSLLGLQFILGVADVALLAPTWMQIVHLLGADLYWVALVVTTAAVVWPIQTSAAQAPNG